MFRWGCRCGLTAALVVLIAGTAAPLAGDEDPFAGKHRDELQAWIGTPDKEKRLADGSAVLTYKLVRLDPEHAPPADMRVLTLPEVGLVGRVDRARSPERTPATVGPPEIDKRGRPVSSGTTPVQSGEASWDPETGEMKRSWDARDDSGRAHRGKVKLQLRLDADGRVSEWSVSPKPKS